MLFIFSFAHSEERKIAIVGAGPAGLSAAIYAARAMHEVVLYTGHRDSQLLKTEQVDNYIGAPEVSGFNLMEKMLSQLKGLNIELIERNVVALSKEGHRYRIEDKNGDVRTYKAVIFATGSVAKTLHLENEDQLWGRGLSTCALCDGNLFKGKDVVVIGGGNSALEEALYLSRIARRVYIVHRRDSFRGDKTLQEALRKQSNIITCMDSEVVKLNQGNGSLTGIELISKSKKKRSEIRVSGVFYAIGSMPNTQCLDSNDFKDILGSGGEVVTTKWGVVTDMPGFFVAGDVADRRFSQAITAAGDGCKAALEMDAYIGQR